MMKKANNTTINSVMDRSHAMRANFSQMEYLIKKQVSSPRDQLIINNYRLAIRIASRYRGNGLNMEDLIGFAYIGLVEAADHFDPTANTDFALFASYWIQGEVCQGLNNTGHLINIPKHIRGEIAGIQEEQRRFFLQNGREAMPEELADILQMPIQTVTDILLALNPVDSLDATIGNAEDSYRLSDTITDTSNTRDYAHQDKNLHLMEQTLRQLRRRERTIVTGVHLQGKNFTQLAQELKITPRRVRQIYRQICPF